MKTLITTLTLASLVATSAFAKTAVHARHVDSSDILAMPWVRNSWPA